MSHVDKSKSRHQHMGMVTDMNLVQKAIVDNIQL